ncbi:hypothetical protein HPB47_012744 [Ixodes persulcatus]|uniref:Uncharacterized protein n=1 Tax=Ixodes persulcatus TaxID=34615 RepID=A0AC60NSL3_IXOPE|nr:hypothetical protein HPB47_012744 [Ixodes persulcatus]
MAKSPAKPAPKAFGTLGTGRILEPVYDGSAATYIRDLSTLRVRRCPIPLALSSVRRFSRRLVAGDSPTPPSVVSRPSFSQSPHLVPDPFGSAFLDEPQRPGRQKIKEGFRRGAEGESAPPHTIEACIDDNMAMVEFLVEHGCNPNLGDNEGWTPLHATASCGFVSVARYLIENGANVALVNNDGDLPIDIAESGEMEELLQAEIDRLGVDCDAARNEEERLMLEDAKQMLNSSRVLDKVHAKTGATSLHVAAAKGYLKVMTLLIQAGVDLNAQDWDGWTPLHAASHWGQKEACRLLCDSLANMALPNHVGQTCFDLADPEVLPTLEELKKKQASMQKERPEIQEILERKAQRPPLKRRTSVTRMSLADKNSAVVKDTSSERNAIEAHMMLAKVDEEAERKSEEREIRLLPNSLEERQVARKNEVNRAVSNAFLENAADATTPAVDKTRQSVEKEGEEVTLALRRLRRPSPAPNVEPCPVETVVTVAHPQRESVITPASPPPVAVATITIDDKKKEPSPPSEIVTLRKRLRVNAEPENADDATTPSENSSQGPLKRTFVMPVRDEESETQRKAHAKRVRETRRSTQGVMLEDLKSAEQQLQKKQQERDEGRQEKPPSSAAAAVATTTATTTTCAPSSATTTTALSEELGRRLSWRNRDKQEEEVPAVRVVPSSPDGTPVVTLSMPARARVQRATITGSGDVSHTVTVPIRPRSALDDLSLRDGSDADKDDSRTNSAVQRRRRPKRRSTGVVYLEGEGSQETSPEKESADQDKLRIGAHDLSNDVKGASVKAGVWRVASPRTPSHAGSPAHVWLCVAFPCPGKRASWWLSRARGRFGPFGAPRVLENLVGFSYKAKKQHSGDLLVEVTTKKQSEAILKLTCFLDVKVSVSPHRTLNTIRGVLSEDDFLHTSTYSDAVRRGPPPRTESKATQVSPEALAVALRAPTPPQGQQLPPPSGGSTSAAPKSQDRQAMPMPVLTSTPSPGGKERHSRPNSLERASSTKERHNPRAALPVSKGQERVDLGENSLSTSSASSAGSGRGRGLPPRTSSLPRSTGSAPPLEVEAMEQCTELSTPASDQDDMEWQLSKTKHKGKKPVIAPK